VTIDNQLDNKFGSYPTLTNDQVLSTGSFDLSPRPAVDPNNPPWGVGGALLVWLASLLLMLFVPLIFLIVYALQLGLDFANPDFVKAFAELATTDKRAILLQVISLLPIHLLTFAMVWALVTRFGKFPFLRTIGWEWPNRLWPWLSVILGGLLYGAGVLIAWLVGADKPTQLEEIIYSSVAARYAIAFLAVFTAPFVEEFVYRGILFASLQRLAGAVVAGSVTLGLFTMIHVPQYWPNLGVLAAVGFLSVALTIVRAKTGRLLPCIAIHFVFNGIQSVILIIAPHFSKAGALPDPAPTMSLLTGLGLF